MQFSFTGSFQINFCESRGPKLPLVMSSTACIKWIKIGSPSFKPTLNVGLLLASSQVDCTNPCIASLIFSALDLVIGPSGTCKGSLRLGPLWFPSVWIFVLNRTSPIFLAKRTRWRDWGQKCHGAKFRPSQKTRFWSEFFDETGPKPLFGPNWLYGAFGGKIVPDENFTQFCLESPLEFVFPKNTFSVWIFVQNRSSPIFLAKRNRWRDWGQKCPGAKFRPSKKTRFRMEFFDETGPIPLFWA